MSLPISRKILYPFVVVATATVALIVSNGLTTTGLSVFYRSVQKDLVESGSVAAGSIQSEFSIGPALTIMLAGFLAPLGGFLIGRIGLKRVMLIGCALLGGGLVLYSTSTDIVGVYAAHALLGVSLCFVGVVPCSSFVSKWFTDNRGLALGVALTGTNLGGMLVPRLAVPLIGDHAWRDAMLYLSGLVWLVLLPLVLLVVREPRGEESGGVAETREEEGATLWQALASPSFWALALCAALIFYAIFAVLQQFNLFMQNQLGFELKAVGLFLFSLSLWTIIGKFAFGFVSDRISALKVFVVAVALMFGSTLMLWRVTPETVPLFGPLFGLSYGAAFVMLQMIVADLFGKRDYPRILGALHFVQTLGGAAGLLVTGFIADANGGDFAPAFRVLIGIMGAALALAVVLNVLKMRRPASDQGTFESI